MAMMVSAVPVASGACLAHPDRNAAAVAAISICRIGIPQWFGRPTIDWNAGCSISAFNAATKSGER
jgi:hypothetical protein